MQGRGDIRAIDKEVPSPPCSHQRSPRDTASTTGVTTTTQHRPHGILVHLLPARFAAQLRRDPQAQADRRDSLDEARFQTGVATRSGPSLRCALVPEVTQRMAAASAGRWRRQKVLSSRARRVGALVPSFCLGNAQMGMPATDCRAGGPFSKEIVEREGESGLPRAPTSGQIVSRGRQSEEWPRRRSRCRALRRRRPSESPPSACQRRRSFPRFARSCGRRADAAPSCRVRRRRPCQ